MIHPCVIKKHSYESLNLFNEYFLLSNSFKDVIKTYLNKNTPNEVSGYVITLFSFFLIITLQVLLIQSLCDSISTKIYLQKICQRRSGYEFLFKREK
jgi:hypothetical protein